MSYIKKILMPGERVLYSTRLHPVIYMPVFAWILLSVIFFFYGPTFSILQMNFEGFALYKLLGIGFLICALLSVINTFILLKTSEYALTNRRVIAKVGWLRQVSLDVLLQKVESVTVRQTIFGRMFDYGTIIICGTGGSKDPFFKVCRPLEFRSHIQHEAEHTLHEASPTINE